MRERGPSVGDTGSALGVWGGLICCSMCLGIEAPPDLADLDHGVFGSSS